MRLLVALALLAANATPLAQPTRRPTTGSTFRTSRGRLRRGQLAFARGDYERARRAYAGVLKLAPDNLLGLINLGVVEYSLKKFEDAESHLKKAVQIKLDAAPAWLTLGIITWIGTVWTKPSAAYPAGNPR